MENTEFIDDNFRYKGLLDDIGNLSSYEAISEITYPALRDYQAKDLLHILAVKSFICMYDTGLGKTYVAGGFFKALKNAKIGDKFLAITTNSNISSFCKEITKCTGLRCVYYTEGLNRILNPIDVDSHDVIVITHGCLNVVEHMTMLTTVVDQFKAIVVDELHLVSNFNESKRGYMMKSILSRFEYKLGLTATPMTTDESQLAKALHLINPIMVPNWKALSKDLKDYGSGVIDSHLRDLYVVRQREYNRHKGYLVEIEPLPHQVEAVGEELFYITKGEGAYNSFEKVMDIHQSLEGKRGLIYANLTLVQNALYDYLTSMGIKTVVINGKMTRSEKDRRAEAYRNGEFEIVITNITEAIDLTSDYVVFYEFTSHVKQLIGRAERTLDSKELPIYFLVVKDTGEFDYFLRNVYNRCQMVEDLLNFDLKEVTGYQRSNYFSD